MCITKHWKRPIIATNTQSTVQLRVPPRMKVFGWLMINKKILKITVWGKRMAIHMCHTCRRDRISTTHLRWLLLRFWHVPHDEHPLNMRSRPIDALLKLPRIKKDQRDTLISMFVIWREHCARIFRNQQAHPATNRKVTQQLASGATLAWHKSGFANILLFYSAI